MASTSKRKGEGTSRVMAKLKASVEDGQYYEAHQMYRTVYSRYVSQKKTTEALKLVFGGSVLFLQHDQIGSGLDLSLLFLDLMVTEKCPVDDERLDQIAQLYESFGGSHAEEKTRFMNRAIRWTIRVQKKVKYGHPRLHQLAAFTNWKEGNYGGSRQHFLYCDYPSDFAEMLVEVSVKEGLPGEYDLFLTQAVLHLLVLQKHGNAQAIFNQYIHEHPAFSGMQQPFKVPLFNFIALLLQSVERKALSMFNCICKLYQPSLKRDPDYEYFLCRIGSNYFGLPGPQKADGLGSMLGSLLQSVFGEGEGEEERQSQSGAELKTEEELIDSPDVD